MSNAFEQRLSILQDKARNTTDSPGVYRMLDKDSKIIYIGKAKSLAHRVSSYFRPNIDDNKTRTLVSRIHSFDVILTQTEAEALILESILIKKHKPRYNIMLKDDKSYPYVMVDEGHTFPKVLYVRRPKKKKNVKLYGPFASSYSLRSALRTLNRIFRLRDCSDSEFANRSRPCINHQIGICSAPCTGYISAEAYRQDVDSALQVLSGHGKETLNRLGEEMEKHSAAEEFEQAARERDQIFALQDTISRKKSGSTVEREAREGGNRDVIGWYRKPEAASIALLFVRGGNLVDSATFHLDDLEGRSDEEVLSQFLAQFYLTGDRLDPEEDSHAPTGSFAFPGAEGKTWPDELLLPFTFPDLDVLVQSFQELNHKVTVTLPQKGVKHEMLLLGEKNAENAFDERQREKGSIYRVLAELKAKLRLENYPRRIECYDISNLGDTGIVASRVTFIEGKPDKSLYRHYKIRSTTTQNDFAAMREVIERRLVKTLEDAKNYEEPPDLLIVDGGKGQLSMAVQVFQELNITGVDLVALAKAKAVDLDDMLAERKRQKAEEVAGRQASQTGAEAIEAVKDLPGTGEDMPEVGMEDPVTEDLLEQRASLSVDNREIVRGFERIFKPGRMNPIVLAPDAPVTHLLQRVRDEAHRFAVNFQRQQRKF